MIAVKLPWPVSVNRATFNVLGKGRVVTKELAAWRTEAGLTLKQKRFQPIHGHYDISIQLHRKDYRRLDIGNFEKCISDLLVEHGIIEDDSKAVRITLSRYRSDENAAIVTVYPVAEIPSVGGVA